MQKNTIIGIRGVTVMLAVTLLFSCQSNKKNTEDEAKQQHLEEKNPVETIVLERDTFNRELVSNGTLEALKKASLRFETGGKLASIPVENGDFVKKGELLAQLDDYKLRNRLKKTTH